MPYEVSRMSRPLTTAERARIEKARRKIEALQAKLDAATRERDAAILAAYDRRVKVVEIAEVAGVARQTVHTIVKQLPRED
jgi:DNA-directed RNA polymerase specialized sigma24 family protein